MKIRDGIIKKGIVFGTSFLFICVAIIPATGLPKTAINVDTEKNSIFGLQSYIAVSWNANDTSEPIIPNGGLRYIALNVTYLIMSGIFGRFILFFCRDQWALVELEIVDQPTWCTAAIGIDKLVFSISDVPSTQANYLTVAVNENAPAFEPFAVKIKAKVEPVRGPFGLLSLIKDFEVIDEIILAAAYLPLIDVTPESTLINATPGNTTELPIVIENLGNGKTTVHNNIIDYPQEWIIIIPPHVVLEVNESKEVNLSITPPENFTGIEAIKIAFTPKYFYNPIFEGTTLYVYIVVRCRS